jgi:Cu-processing system ATP-binding protein
VRYLPEHAGFPPNLTGREILRFHARMRSVPGEKRPRHVERILHTVGLANAADRPVSGYSNGMNRRLGLGTALVGDPAVLVLDEPTAGLDPEGIQAFHDIVGSLAAETEVTIVFSSHALSEIEQLCDEAVVVAGGSVAMRGPVESLRRAAGDEVTVRLTLADADEAQRATTTLRDEASAGSVSLTGPRLEVTCRPDSAYDLLTAVRQRHAVDRFEVREPGLEAAFHEAVGTATSAGPDVGSDEATGGETA